jgi:hypothetical protein
VLLATHIHDDQSKMRRGATVAAACQAMPRHAALMMRRAGHLPATAPQ